MEIIFVTLGVSAVLFTSYIYFSKKEQNKFMVAKAKQRELNSFYQKDIARTCSFQLAGVEADGNSDYRFSEVIKNIQLSSETRIKLYD